MHQIWKKRTKWSLKGDGKKETALVFEVSNTKSNIPPCIWVEYCECWDKLKFWIRGLTLATCSSNIWSRLKSPTINILCCVGSSLISEIKSPTKEPRWPGIRYTITKNSLLFYFRHNWQYLENTRYFNYFNDVYLIHIVTQSQTMMCILMNVFPIIQDFINMFCRTGIYIGFCEAE